MDERVRRLVESLPSTPTHIASLLLPRSSLPTPLLPQPPYPPDPTPIHSPFHLDSPPIHSPFHLDSLPTPHSSSHTYIA
ncbi:hypothetical protein Pcinc_039895 [Petrolisthes cinctipes]|uniref:Uncharacterized protein n=1 Tax=Petrolisthes cinctipes TaxID=88211 RepID=A0AAE1EIM6_PETCI|nr:hypothetical protein Pcinc_039895 [Petrolisthes cinctipes]